MENKKIGLLFGSFNPIHVGHLFMAEMCIENTNLDEVWFVVSPQSPYKTEKGLLTDVEHRINMVNLSIKDREHFKISTVELKLPYPSYTSNTMEFLTSQYSYDFYIICGTDVYTDIPNWIGGEKVIELSKFIVYPRSNSTVYSPEKMKYKTTWIEGVPSFGISSTFIRNQIKNNKTTKHLLTENVIEYINKNKLYYK